MLSGYPRAAQISASETPVLPPVYSTTRPPGSRRLSRSAASIMARAIRSFMLPVGFTLSTLIKMRAHPLGTMRLSSSSGVDPMRSRMEASMRWVLIQISVPAGTVCMQTLYVYTYIDDTEASFPQDTGGRCARRGSCLRRHQRPPRGAADHTLHGSSHARGEFEHRSIHAHDSFGGSRERHDRCDCRTLGARSINPVSKFAQPGASRACRDYHRRKGFTPPRRMADGKGRTPPGDGNPDLAGGA